MSQLNASEASPGTVEAFRDHAKAAYNAGNLFLAYDEARQGLARFPDDVPLKHRLVLSLAQAGALEEAERQFGERGLGEVDTVEVRSLRARLEKSRAIAATGSKRQDRFLAAADLYRAVWQRHRDVYPGINAATCLYLGGRKDESRQLAGELLGGMSGSATDYWTLATRIEALLLLDRIDEAHALAAAARKAAGTDYAMLAATAQQLAQIGEARNGDRHWFPWLAVPPVIHFCGHMADAAGGARRIGPADEPKLRRAIATLLAETGVSYAFGALASGADIIIAEEILKIPGSRLTVVLPFDREEFIGMSVIPGGPEWEDRFTFVFARPEVDVTMVTDGGHLGDDSLFTHGTRIGMGLAKLRARHLSTEHMQVGVWNGDPPAGVAGTAVDVATGKASGFRQVLFNIDGSPMTKPPPDLPPTVASDGAGRVPRAMLFGDISGFSKLSDALLPIFVKEVIGRVAAVIDRHRPRMYMANSWGDGLFMVFHNPTDAASCALELQAAMTSVDFAGCGLPNNLRLRVGINWGPAHGGYDPILLRPNVYGAHVSRAARIEPVTPPGSIYVTDSFAAALTLEDRDRRFECAYVGITEAAKKYGAMPLFLLRRAGGIAEAAD